MISNSTIVGCILRWGPGHAAFLEHLGPSMGTRGNQRRPLRCGCGRWWWWWRGIFTGQPPPSAKRCFGARACCFTWSWPWWWYLGGESRARDFWTCWEYPQWWFPISCLNCRWGDTFWHLSPAHPRLTAPGYRGMESPRWDHCPSWPSCFWASSTTSCWTTSCCSLRSVWQAGWAWVPWHWCWPWPRKATSGHECHARWSCSANQECKVGWFQTKGSILLSVGTKFHDIL